MTSIVFVPNISLWTDLRNGPEIKMSGIIWTFDSEIVFSEIGNVWKIQGYSELEIENVSGVGPLATYLRTRIGDPFPEVINSYPGRLGIYFQDSRLGFRVGSDFYDKYGNQDDNFAPQEVYLVNQPGGFKQIRLPIHPSMIRLI